MNFFFFLYLTLLGIPPLLKIIYVENSVNNAIHFSTYLFLLGLVSVLLNLRPKKILMITFPLFIFNIFQMVHFLHYREIITVGGWAAIFESNYLEAKEFILAKPSSCLVLIFHLGVFAAAVALAKDFLPVPSKKIKAIAIIILTAFFVEFIGFGFFRGVYPFESILALQNYFEEKEKVSRLLEARKNGSYNASRTKENSGKKETYVIVIGESARRKNMEIYGYHRPTNPKLKQEKLWVFKDAVSPVNITRESLRLILSPGTVTRPEESFKKKSLVGLCRELGFTTYWIGNQSRYGFRDSEITAMAKESHHLHFTNTYWAIPSPDTKVLPALRKVLEEPSAKKMIFIHLLGNHIDYKKRYPSNFNAISSLYRNKTKAEKITSEYDISTAYVDSILAEMIHYLKEKNQISSLLYFSDHGEFLFDNGSDLFGHGFPDPYPQEYQVPFFLWTSSGYEQAHPDVINGIKSNLGKKIQLENLFHSVAYMLSASYNGQILGNVFFSTDFSEPKTRQVANPGGNLFTYENL